MYTDYEFRELAEGAAHNIMRMFKGAVLSGDVESRSDIEPYADTLKSQLVEWAESRRQVTIAYEVASDFLIDAVDYFDSHK